MIEYVAEESVRPDGAIRWVVTDMRAQAAGRAQDWSCLDEVEALELAAKKMTPNGLLRVGRRDGRHMDFTSDGAVKRAHDIKNGVGVCADCGQDITQQNPDVMNLYRIKFHALLCRPCGKKRERVANGGLLEVRTKRQAYGATAKPGQMVEQVQWETTDGQRFNDKRRAEGHQKMISHNSTVSPNPAMGGQANAASPHPAPTATLMGVLFIMANAGTKGEFWWSDADKAWITHQDTYNDMRAGNNTDVQRQIAELRKARMEGRPVVKAQVTRNPRRPEATPRQRKGDLTDLLERTKRMVVQIAAMSDRGAIPDGQVAELSKTYAALQNEFNEAMGCVEEIKENLSIMRAIMFEHSDPRNARDAIA